MVLKNSTSVRLQLVNNHLDQCDLCCIFPEYSPHVKGKDFVFSFISFSLKVLPKKPNGFMQSSCKFCGRMSCLPPANEVCEGYVFTGVCLSTGGACVACGRGAYIARDRGGEACVAGGCAWLVACMAGGVHGMAGGACMPQQIPWDTVNERAVRILLECILV